MEQVRPVVVVDDDLAILTVIEKTLVRNGYEAKVFTTSEAALDFIGHHAVLVVLVDVIMPEPDGIDLIASLKRTAPDIPVIAMSGGGQKMPSDLALALAQRFGVDILLSKPFDGQTLIGAIRQCCGE